MNERRLGSLIAPRRVDADGSPVGEELPDEVNPHNNSERLRERAHA
jgi:hypothetical protein